MQECGLAWYTCVISFRIVKLTSPYLNYFIVAGALCLFGSIYIRVYFDSSRLYNGIRCNVITSSMVTLSLVTGVNISVGLSLHACTSAFLRNSHRDGERGWYFTRATPQMAELAGYRLAPSARPSYSTPRPKLTSATPQVLPLSAYQLGALAIVTYAKRGTRCFPAQLRFGTVLLPCSTMLCFYDHHFFHGQNVVVLYGSQFMSPFSH